mmetsp:Transcript_34619/g.68909  ORF Transcript_34619/g.68909 Transcript_34619/m.68909 type:complete len:143 (-) Transcript_34619:686-1114(-)
MVKVSLQALATLSNLIQSTTTTNPSCNQLAFKGADGGTVGGGGLGGGAVSGSGGSGIGSGGDGGRAGRGRGATTIATPTITFTVLMLLALCTTSTALGRRKGLSVPGQDLPADCLGPVMVGGSHTTLSACAAHPNNPQGGQQ